MIGICLKLNISKGLCRKELGREFGFLEGRVSGGERIFGNR